MATPTHKTNKYIKFKQTVTYSVPYKQIYTTVICQQGKIETKQMKWHGVERTKKSSTENLKPPKMKKKSEFLHSQKLKNISTSRFSVQ